MSYILKNKNNGKYLRFIKVINEDGTEGKMILETSFSNANRFTQKQIAEITKEYTRIPSLCISEEVEV